MKLQLIALLALMAASSVAAAAPPVSVDTVSVSSPTIRIWDIKVNGAVRQGSSTSRKEGQLIVNHGNGTQTSHDATFKVESGTLFQDGEICHNFGTRCFCGTTTFRLESGMAMWKFGTPSNNQPVPCPSGIQPTGDADIRKSMSREDVEALKQKILRERAAARTKAQSPH